MSRPPVLRLALLAAALAWASPPGALLAQDEELVEPLDELVEPQEVEMSGLLTCVVGAGRLVTMPEQIERVALADETLARVQLISTRELLLTGLKPGRSTLFVWLVDGRRLRYTLQSDPDLDLVLKLVAELDPGIVVETSGGAVVLRGEVADRATAFAAMARVRELLPGTQLVNLMRAPDEGATDGYPPDERLAAALAEVDPRIRVRRIQVGGEPAPDLDTYVLEGRVKNLAALVRAMTVAERQLGGAGVGVVAVEGGQGLAAGAFVGAQALGLAAQVSRDLVMTSPSGRVISFLEIDELPQILVSIRVLEVDRAKARTLGVDFAFDRIRSDGSVFGASSATGAGGGAGNLVLSYVDDMTDILATIDALEDKQLARSVAEPNVLTLAGEQATVVIGGQIPIPTTTVNQVTTVQSFRFQEFGVRLDIRPTLVEGDVITLEVSPEITRTQQALAVGQVPAFTFRNVRTTARVPAGQSLVIAGLMDFEEVVQERKVPGLGWLPLFRWQRRGRSETELIFVITPRLVEFDPAAVGAPVPPLEVERLELPPLEWPEDSRRWRDAYEPEMLTFEGVPPEFLQAPWEPREPPLGPLPEAATALPAEPLPPPAGEPRSGVVFGTEEAPDDGALDGGQAVVSGTSAGETRVWSVAPWVDPCLNLRVEPGLWRRPLSCLPPGSLATELESTDGWMRVRLFDGREGWMASRYLEPVAASDLGAVTWQAAPEGARCVTMRAEPFAESTTIDCLRRGTPVELLETTDGWSRVRLIDGRHGWVRGELLRPAE